MTSSNPYPPGDLRHTFCALLDGMALWAKINHELDQARHFERAARPRCGNCRLWMTRACPAERNVNGRNRGPHMNGAACAVFAEKEYVQDYRDTAAKHRAAAAISGGAP